ncbi:MAG: beta-ketoacyl-ACP synthase II [Chloroflexota bacterium]|nr:beta-ketoacyl-ACP synthase II [Chloroflexota bacterium]
MAELRRVVITGIGAITPIGNDAETFWQSLIAGKSGTGPITHFDASEFPVKVAGEIKGFDPGEVMEHRAARRSGRFAQIAVKAAKEALISARLELDHATATEMGVILGSTGGVFEMGRQETIIDQRGPNRVDPLIIPKWGPHMSSGRVARELGLRGPNSSVNSACASATDALGHAFNMIRTGSADILLGGGTEAIITPVAIATMGLMGALSKGYNDTPERASRPFDAGRDGFVLGEGAGVLVLESLEHAEARGATILAEYIGHGWSFDAADDAAPDAEGQSLSMIRALKSAGIAPGEVSWLNAHGTGTPYNDKTETAAIKLAFGDAAYRVPLSSIKSMTGHSAAAAGALEAVASVLAMRDNKIPPTINYETPDPECDLDIVPNTARDARIDVVLSNSFGMGGQNATLVLRRWRESV